MSEDKAKSINLLLYEGNLNGVLVLRIQNGIQGNCTLRQENP